MAKKKMTLKAWEGSPADKRQDKATGFKEGSKRDNALDKKAVEKINKKRKKGQG